MSLLGEPAPGFTHETTAGGTVTLSDTLETGPTVVILNRGSWCSYCAEQLGTFSDLGYDMWRHLNVDILPIVGDPVPELVEMRDRFNLHLQLVSDPDLETTRAYTGIESNQKHGDIPIAGTFIVDTDGIVRYEQVAEDPSDRTYANYVRHVIKNEFEAPYQDFSY